MSEYLSFTDTAVKVLREDSSGRPKIGMTLVAERYT